MRSVTVIQWLKNGHKHAKSIGCTHELSFYDEALLACNSFDALTEANKNLALLLESARHYVVKAGTTGAFELRNRIDAVLAQVRK